jgi:hypothetical protein
MFELTCNQKTDLRGFEQAFLVGSASIARALECEDHRLRLLMRLMKKPYYEGARIGFRMR